MIKKVERYMEQHRMMEENDVVIAGVSGGADSVCLFLILEEYCRKKNGKLVVVHVNHGIRPDAGQDAQYVKQLCEEYGIVFHLYEIDVKKKAKELGTGEEEAGRTARYEAFNEVLALYGGKGKIAVAHNKGDQAETVLFHMFRGSNITGLCGIAPTRESIIRPLLCLERREIEDYLKEKGRKFCIDSTNEENTYTRNKIRNVILSYAEEEICTNAISHIGNIADELMSVRQYINEQASAAANHVLIKKEDRICIIKDYFTEQHEVIQKQLIVEALERLVPGRKDIGSVHVKDIIELFSKESGKRVNLPYGLLAETTYEWVVIRKEKEIERPDTVSLFAPGIYELQDGRRVELSVLKHDNYREIPRKTYTKWFDYDKIVNCPELRSRKTGDYLIITNTGNRKTIKEYFIEEKIPREERERMLVLADGNHILWVIGKRISEYYKVTEETEKILQVIVR